jgi:hypothetical protein
MKNKNSTLGKAVAVGAGVAALAAAGYFFFGPAGEKNRKKMKGWVIKMKGEIVEKMESVKEVTEPVYNSIVDGVAAKYASVVDQAELDKLVKELKRHWKMIAGNNKPTAKKAVAKTGAKKVVAKAVTVAKKAVKKAAKKTK